MAEVKPNNPKPKTPKVKRRKLDIWNKLAIGVLSTFLIGCITVFFVLVNIINDPDGLRFTEDGLNTLSSSRVYDANGNMFFELGKEIREDVTYDQVPQVVIDAFLSIEDSRYFEHNGFDLPRFISAALNNLRKGDFSQGGSTLTMQMIDNSFTKIKEDKIKADNGGVLPKKDNLKLKVQEIYLSLIAEQKLDKEAIFENYINKIWFGSGNNTRGIQKASHYFFSKDVTELNLGEAAFLAGAINSPYLYNPINNTWNPDVDHLAQAQNRRNQTLQLMLNHGYITEEEYNLAVNTKLSFALKVEDQTSSNPYQAYFDQVIQECIELTGEDPAVIPMDIYTAMIPEAQQQANAICNGEIIQFPNDAYDIGFAMVNNSNGEIICVAPGRRYHTQTTKHDNSITKQQPGSSIKPILDYAPAFDILGWSTEHTVNDKKGDYWKNGQNQPANSDRKYMGKMNLADALGLSRNTTAAATLQELIDAKGYDYWIDYLKKLGYDDDVAENFNIQYSIGAQDMYCSPVQQASAFSMLANGGKRVNAHRIRKVVRRSDNQEIAGNTETFELISPEAAFMTSHLLAKVVTGNYQNFNEILQSDYPVYAKSGTSDWAPNNYGIPEGVYKDEWSIGYTSAFSIATWSGYTDEYRKQGWYFDDATLFQAQAFHISHYMLDFCKQFGDYSGVQRPEGVSDYKGGYIKDEFLSKGDNISKDKDDEEDKDKDEDEEKEETPSAQESACSASGGSWNGSSCACPEGTELQGDSCVTKQPEDPYKEAREACIASGKEWDSATNTCKDPAPVIPPEQSACENSGGTWNGSSCACPEGTTWDGTTCAVLSPDNGGAPEGQSGKEKIIEPRSYSIPLLKGLFNLFNWL